MNIYYVWVTALIPQYQDGIIASLVKKGYMVGAADRTGKVVSYKDNNPSALIALNVYKVDNVDIPVDKVYDDVLAILTEMKVFFHSIIVTISANATWVGSNIMLPVKDKVIPPPLPPETKKNMN